MRLALDARGLRAGVDGIGRFSLGVLKGLARQRPDWELQVLVPSESLPHLEGQGVSAVPLDAPRFRPGEERKVRRLLGTLGSDAYLNLSMAGPRPSVPSMITVHDLMVLKLSGYFGPNPLRNLLARSLFGLII